MKALNPLNPFPKSVDRSSVPPNLLVIKIRLRLYFASSFFWKALTRHRTRQIIGSWGKKRKEGRKLVLPDSVAAIIRECKDLVSKQ